MSYDEWKLEDDLCRCCHSEGSFKYLSSSFKSGNEEVYSDMLRFTLDIHLAPVLGPLCTATYTICEPCILKLKEATIFKKQVLRCEEKFKDMYTRNIIKVAAAADVEIKDEPPDVKENAQQDVPYMDGDDFHMKDDVDDRDDGDDDELISKSVKHEGKKRSKKTPTKSKSQPKPKKPPKRGRPRKTDDDDAANEKINEGNPRGITDDYYTLQTINGFKKYTCNTCKRVYQSLTFVKQHYIRVHLKPRLKLRSCYMCDVKLPEYRRAAHLEEAHGIPAPSCSICGKKFNFRHQMLTHQKDFHTGEKRFKCRHCVMIFSTRANLTTHEIKHSEERRHKCEYCGKAFKWKSSLRIHIMIHLDDRRHVCSVCNEAFVQKSSLKYHTKKKHPEMV